MKSMFGILSITVFVRVLSVACMLVPVATVLVWPEEGVVLDTAVYSILAASILLALQPFAEEDSKTWVIFSVLILLVEAVFFIIDFPPSIYVSACLLLVLLYDLLRFLERCSVLRNLFKPQAVWLSIESHSRLLFSFAVFATVIPMKALSGRTWALLPVMLLSAGLYSVLFYRSLSGRCLVLSADKERIVKQMIRSAADMSAEAVKGEEPAELEKMQTLYGRIMKILESGRPFLDPDYSLGDLANAAFTNKTYVSKTINTMSGKNFRQFVNAYRVQYAVELLRSNPRLTVGQLAEKSGFNSSVTFGMAFKLNMGETPGEYLIRHRAGLV